MQFYIVGILFLIFDLEILLIYPLAVTLYQVSTYGFWIVIIFFIILTVGFVLEIGSGALYFSEQKSSISDLRPQNYSPNKPLPQGGQINQRVIGSRLIHTKAGLMEQPSHDSSTDQEAELSSLEYFKEIYEVDKGQPTNNVYLLAKRHIASGAPTDAKDINQCLSKFGLSITPEELEILVSIEKVELQLPLEPNELLLSSIGRDLSLNHKDSANNRFPGVYVFTHKTTGEQYVGSSINLGSRVRTYFQPGIRANESRLIIQSLNKYGVENFTLSIYKIDPKLFENNFKPLDFSRALEQYYIFTLNSVLNEIKVAGGFPGGPMEENTKLAIGKANSIPIYVYNQDKSILLYSAPSTWSFLREVKMAHNTLSTHLASGEALYGKFVFSRELIQGAVISLMDVNELSQILADARALQNIQNLPHPNVSTTLIDNETGKEYLFNSLVNASKFTKSFALNNSRYIAQSKLSNMKSGDSFKGWTVRKN